MQEEAIGFTKRDPPHVELPNGGGELVLDGSNVIAQAKEQATGVRVLAVFGVAALVIRFLRS
jgi:hypothetical protein